MSIETLMKIRRISRRVIDLPGPDAYALERALTETEKERDAALAEVERMRPVVEAACDWVDGLGGTTSNIGEAVATFRASEQKEGK